jgi:hypothetical protein
MFEIHLQMMLDEGTMTIQFVVQMGAQVQVLDYVYLYQVLAKY